MAMKCVFVSPLPSSFCFDQSTEQIAEPENMENALRDAISFRGQLCDLVDIVSTRNVLCHPPIHKQLKLEKVIDDSDLDNKVKIALCAALQ